MRRKERKEALVDQIMEKLTKTYKGTAAVTKKVTEAMYRLTEDQLDGLHVLLITAMPGKKTPTVKEKEVIADPEATLNDLFLVDMKKMGAALGHNWHSGNYVAIKKGIVWFERGLRGLKGTIKDQLYKNLS